GKALALADLPDEVVAAFSSPLDLQFRWAKPLSDALAANPEGVLARARILKTQPGKIAPRDVFEHLTGEGEGVERFNPPKPIHIDVRGKRAATVTAMPKGGATVTIAPGAIRVQQTKALAEIIASFLKEDRK
ncbi:MAG: hypothetical protein M3Z37_01065, partial [Candidatus Eremiobacteraeota bacterium]|nr:hypothetical protein [Candidatus Eremiobacteraeota bacterium]